MQINVKGMEDNKSLLHPNIIAKPKRDKIIVAYLCESLEGVDTIIHSSLDVVHVVVGGTANHDG